MFIIYLLYIYLQFLQNVHSFNMDLNVGNAFQFFLRTESSSISAAKNMSSESQFGFMQKFVKVDSNWKLLVGAPQAKGYRGEPDGSVYHCNMDNANTCSMINTTTGSVNQSNGEMMGFSAAVSGDKTMTCATMFHDTAGLWEQFRGKCSVLDKDFKQIAATSPCQDRDPNQGGHGYCTLGISITGATNAAKELFIVGAPGAVDWRGVIFAIRQQEPRGQDQYENFRSEEYKKNSDDATNSFFGYSVTFGRFVSDTGLGDVAVSAPRANNLQGIVHIVSLREVADGIDFQFLDEINLPVSDQQIGSYFGATLEAVDLNNNKKDDLLIAAPFFSSRNANEGRVYVYMNSEGTFVGLTYKATLIGEATSGGQFGIAISNVGDLNRDGYNDVAISAPFGGPDGSGAVYIYNGGFNGIRIPYSQKIYASDLPNVGKAFGYSISQGADVDNNGYSDFSIGSFDNGWVYTIRARPVVTLSDSLKTNVTEVSPELLKSNCIGPDGKQYQCVEFKLNLRDVATKGPDSFDAQVTIKLDEKNAILQKQRALVVDSNNKLVGQTTEDVSVLKGTTLPFAKILYFKTGIDLDDVVSPVKISTSYVVLTNNAKCNTQLCPVLDAYGVKGSEIEVSYQRLCETSVCKTDLRLTDSIIMLDKKNSELTFGLNKVFSIETNVKNYGEPAYQSVMKLDYSHDFTIDGIEVNGRARTFTLKKLDDNRQELSFAIGNPVKTEDNLFIKVAFGVAASRPSVKIYNFTMEVSSFGNDTDTRNNQAGVSIGTKIQTCMNVGGYAEPSIVVYGSQNYTHVPGDTVKNLDVTQIGPEVNLYFDEELELLFSLREYDGRGGRPAVTPETESVMRSQGVNNFGELDVNTVDVNIELQTSSAGKQVIYVVDILANGIRCNKNVNKNNLLIPGGSAGNDGSINFGKTRKRRALNTEQCVGPNCEVFKCTITRIAKNNNVLVKVISRLISLNLDSLEKRIASMNASVRVSFSGPDASFNVQDTARSICQLGQTVSFDIKPTSKQTSGNDVQWWWILLAVVAALILLAIVCAILYRIGFFRRKHLEELQTLQAEQQEFHSEQKKRPESETEY